MQIQTNYKICLISKFRLHMVLKKFLESNKQQYHLEAGVNALVIYYHVLRSNDSHFNQNLLEMKTREVDIFSSIQMDLSQE